MKKVIKAHEGMAHVSKPSQGKRRQIGLPQQFRGGNRRRAPMPQAPAPSRRAPVMPEPKVITQPKPTVVRPPPRQSDAGDGRGGIPVRELPNKGRGKSVQRPKPQIRSAQAPRTPMVGKPMQRPRPPMAQPRIMNQGGYMSRAKYGIVDNLKKNT